MMPGTPKKDEKATPPTTYFLGAFFKSDTVMEVCSLYRGTGSGPEARHSTGFHARGKDLDLSRHVIPPKNLYQWHKDSAYVSTTISKDVAAQFATMHGRTVGFVYEIDFQPSALDVTGVILKGHAEGKLTAEGAVTWLGEKERAVPFKIAPEHIRGAWTVTKVPATDVFEPAELEFGSFIRNPGYVPSTFARVVDATKILGRGAAAVGAVVDGLHLYDLYSEGKASDDYGLFFKGATTVATKWAAAAYAGSEIGAAAATAAAPFGPYASLGAGVAGGLVGATAGAFFGERAIDVLSDIGPTIRSAAESALEMLIPSAHADSIHAPGLAPTLPTLTPPPPAALGEVGAALEFTAMRDALEASPYIPAVDLLPGPTGLELLEARGHVPPNPEPPVPSVIAPLAEAAHIINDLMPSPPPADNPPAPAEGLNNLRALGNAIAAAPGVAEVIGVVGDLVDRFILPSPGPTITPPTPTPPTPPAPSPAAVSEARQDFRNYLYYSGYTNYLSPFERPSSLFSETPSTPPPLGPYGRIQETLRSLSFMDLNLGGHMLEWALRDNPLLAMYAPKSGLDALTERIVRDVVSQELLSLFPDIRSAYIRTSTELGYLGLGTSLSTSGFYDIVRASGLVGSYASFNPEADIGKVFEFLCRLSGREPGGIEQKVGLITDLINSPAQEITDFTFCFPTADGSIPFSIGQLRQIEREIGFGYFMHKTLPFFSLDFGQDALGKTYLVPQIHPAYSNTLTGKIISILDYYLKCLLNGVAFDQAFIEEWFKTMNVDEAHLRAHMIDLKKYCKEHAPDLAYLSLRELMKKRGIGETPTGSAYQQPFMTSFRIIAKTAKVEYKDGTFVIHPGFDIKYSIDLMPDYEAYINQYRREHGSYPPDYEATKRCYEEYANLLKGYLLKLPLTRDLMNMLGVVNFFGYFYTTMQAMGKMPVLEPRAEAEHFATPAAFPPLPVRYYQMHPLKITYGELITALHEQEASDASLLKLDAQIKALFNVEEDLEELPADIMARIKRAVIQLILNKLNTAIPGLNESAVNEEEADKYTIIMAKHLLKAIQETKALFESSVESITPPFERIFGLASNPRTLEGLIEIITNQQATVEKRWEENPTLARSELLELLPKQYHKKAIKAFKDIEERNCRLFEELKKKALENAETQAAEAIESEVKEMEEAYDRQVVEGTAEIERIRAEQLANVPSDLSRLTPESRASIEKFKRDMDNELAGLKERAVVAKATARAEIIRNVQEQKDAIRAEITAEAKADEESKMMNDIKTAAIRIYKNFLALHQERLLQRINGLTHHLLSLEKFATSAIGKGEKYSHSVTSFDSNEYNKDGVKVQVKGGCGVSVPNLSSQAIVNAESLATALSSIDASDETWGTLTHAGTTYAVSRMAVKDAAVTSVADYRELSSSLLIPGACTPEEAARIKAAINELILNLEATPTLDAKALTTSIDPSGSKAMHYAAILAEATSLEKLNALHAGQLKLADNFGHLPIHIAAGKGNLHALRFMLANDASLLNATTQKGVTPLIAALQQGQTDAVIVLLEHGANANHQLPNELFPLYMAIQNNFGGLAKLLLAKASSLKVDIVLKNGMTALHLAIEYRLFDVAAELIRRGAPLLGRRKSDGLSPFHIAACVGNIDLINLMLSRGVPIDDALDSGKTALHIAAERGHVDLVKALLAAGAKADAVTIDGDTPCMLAIKAGQSETALLLASTAVVDTCNKQKQTASLLAAEKSMWPVVDCLLQRGENPDLRDNRGLNCTYQLAQQGESSRFEHLFNAGRIDAAQAFNGYSLSAIAAKYGHVGIYSLLLEKRAPFASPYTKNPALYFSVMAVCNDEVFQLRNWLSQTVEKRGFDSIVPVGPYAGKSLAYVAAERGSIRCLEILKATLSDDDIIAQQVLIGAIKSRLLPVVKLCLPRDVERDLDSEGNNALHHAVLSGSREIVEELMRSGLKPNKANKKGQTAFHLAILNNDVYLLKRLLKRTLKEEWPADLHTAIDGHTSTTITQLLKEKGYRLSKPVLSQEERVIVLETERQTAIRKLANYAQLARRVTAFLQTQNFLALHNLLKRYPDLAFAYRLGNQTLLGAVLTFADAPEIDAEEEEDRIDYAKLILQGLKEKGVVLGHHTGIYNPLLSLLQNVEKEGIKYRISLLKEIYPETISQLMLDKPVPDHTVAQIALAQGNTALFAELDKLNAIALSVDHTPLHEAIEANHYELAISLANEKNVNSTNRQLVSPLMLAAKQGNILLMQHLIDCGADPDQVDIQGRNALRYSLMSGTQDAALFLLPLTLHKNRANRYGETVVMHAAAKGMVQVINALCKTEDCTKHVNAYGRTALHIAAIEGQVEAISALVANGFSLNQAENPPGASKNAKSNKMTPLHYAAHCGKAPAVLKLLQLGADPLQQDSMGYTVFEHAIQSKNKELWRVLRALVEEKYSEHKGSLLLAAAKCDHMEILIKMLSEGIDSNTTDKFGNTALHLAAATNSINVTRLLAARSELINYPNRQGHTALHLAAESGNLVPIDALVKAGSLLDSRNTVGMTPLFLACRAGRLPAVNTLIKLGADRTLTDSQGITPAQIALMNGHYDIARLLAKKGDNSFLPENIAALPALIQIKIREHKMVLAECQGLYVATQRASRLRFFSAATTGAGAEIDAMAAPVMGATA